MKNDLNLKIRRLIQYHVILIRNMKLKKATLIKAYGPHLISGYMGCGKTLLVNKLIRSVNSNEYFFFCNKQEFNADNVYYFDVNKLFNDGKQAYKLRTTDDKGRRLYGVIFDEINLSFNRRLNNQKIYNEVFIPLINLIISSRHQGINRVYFIGQKLELQDTQLISLFKYNHDIVYTKRRFTYDYFKNTGAYAKIPVKISTIDYIKGPDDNFKAIGTSTFKITIDDVLSYNTYSFKSDFEKLPDY